jgi:hypothetical protein
MLARLSRPLLATALCALLCACLCAWLARPALANQATDTRSAPKIEINALRDADGNPYRAYFNGLHAFQVFRRLAPQARMRFLLVPRPGSPALDQVRMRIAADDFSIPVQLDPDGTFHMPLHTEAANRAAEVLLNQRAGQYDWRVEVRTPGLPDGVRRLGDARLECVVRWAILRERFPTRAGAFGRTLEQLCHTAQTRLHELAPAPVRGFNLVAGERRKRSTRDAILEEGRRFNLPLEDRDWPDDTLVELEFRR